MPDGTEDRGPQDRARISLEQDHEIRYWTDKLGISKLSSKRSWQRSIFG